MFDGRKSCPDRILMFFSGASPDCVNQMILEWVFIIYGSEVGELDRPLDKLTVWIFNENVL